MNIRCLSHLALTVVGLALATSSPLRADAPQRSPIVADDFQQGDKVPAGWTLSGGQGRWLERNILEATGNGNDSNQWQREYPFEPGKFYRFQMRARSLGNDTSVVSGAEFANHDQPISTHWQSYTHILRAPDKERGRNIRIGQWHLKGTVQFDSVRIAPVTPVYKTVGPFELGDGESIQDGQYSFEGYFYLDARNCHRTLVSATAAYNSNRWCFGGDDQVTYRFGLPGCPMRSGKVQFNICHYAQGGCLAEVSTDQKMWRTLVTRDKLGMAAADLPADLLPADTLYLRLRCTTGNSYLQVDTVTFSAKLGGTPPEGVGQTVFVETSNTSRDFVIDRLTIVDSATLRRPVLRVVVKNRGSTEAKGLFSMQTAPRKQAKVSNEPARMEDAVTFAPGESRTFETATAQDPSGENEIRLSLTSADGKAVRLALPWTLPAYYETDFGQRIDGIGGDNAIWTCDATWKVTPERPVPQTTAAAATLSAAKNDHEAVQIVVQPGKVLKQLTAAAGDLIGPDGATISSKNVQILRVYYHKVHTPTDGTSVRGLWPDALPPLDKPIDVAANRNQPLWVLVRVPNDAKAGDYAGSVTLKAEGWSASVPVRLHVWNFALPETNHIETAFGLNFSNPFRYQQTTSDADKRRLVDMYLQNFADHRISPYNPTPLDPIGVKFEPKANPPRADMDFKAFDAAMTRAIDKYHFTNFVVPLEGMGGGTFEGRSEGKIGEFGEHTPQYQAMFGSYLKQLESHLREKDWLKMAYTYWFDEPDTKDYAFVQSGMDRIKKSAPDLQTMITKHELQPDWNGRIDIWCPISFAYQHEVAEKRRARGERYWWYVCCGPKAPFCTLFIDHPAVELRTWLWQTWQRNIVGILVWESVYWTSQGEPAQNPYEDPMGYVGGTTREEKKYWGNGDGRFLYPPLAAATPGMAGKAPVIEPPVSSIRWEMLREGIEDYEFLWMLRDLIGKKRASLTAEQVKAYESLLEVPAEITTDMTTFSVSPKPIYARRAAIAAAIEQLLAE